MENELNPLEISSQSIDESVSDNKKRQKGTIIGISIAFLVIIGALIAFAVFLLTGDSEKTALIRDVFIIFMALETLLVGVALIILIIQLAHLTNLLQNEIKPILDSSIETVSTLKGTVKFLSNNLTEPVIKLNEYFAGFQSIRKLVFPARRDKTK